MGMFKHIFYNWTWYQKISLTLMFLLIVAAILLGIWILIRNKKYIFFTLTSFTAATIITTLVLLLANIIFKIQITYIFQLTPIIVFVINFIYISMSVGFFISKKMMKNINVEKLQKEFLKDSFLITIFVTLMSLALIFFLNQPATTFILITSVIIILTTWVNYFLFPLFFKQKNG